MKAILPRLSVLATIVAAATGVDTFGSFTPETSIVGRHGSVFSTAAPGATGRAGIRSVKLPKRAKTRLPGTTFSYVIEITVDPGGSDPDPDPDPDILPLHGPFVSDTTAQFAVTCNSTISSDDGESYSFVDEMHLYNTQDAQVAVAGHSATKPYLGGSVSATLYDPPEGSSRCTVDYWVNGAYIGQAQQTRPLTYQVPTGETNDPNSPWGTGLGDLTKVEWRVEVWNAVGTNFFGRTLREQSGGAARAVPDNCYYPGSPIPPYDWGPGEIAEATVEAGNIYHDRIGWAPDAVNHYRAQGREPCDTWLKQDMSISMAPGQAFTRYLTNDLKIAITSITVWVSRADKQIEKVW